MDPNATIQRITEALADRDDDQAWQHRCALVAWLDKGGFPPDHTKIPPHTREYLHEHLPIKYLPLLHD